MPTYLWYSYYESKFPLKKVHLPNFDFWCTGTCLRNCHSSLKCVPVRTRGGVIMINKVLETILVAEQNVISLWLKITYWNGQLNFWHLRKTREAGMVRFNRETCVNSATECVVANERDTVFLLCSFDTVAVQASWVRRGTARHDGKEGPTMGGFPRQEQIPLQWEDHDGSTDGYLLPDLYPHHRHQWPVFWLRVSRCDTDLRSIILHYSGSLSFIDFAVASSSTFVCVWERVNELLFHYGYRHLIRPCSVCRL